MLVLLLATGVHAVDSTRFGFLAQHRLIARNASSISWGNYSADYCASFCEMSGVSPATCTVCVQRMDFHVQEGQTACTVQCQGVQTDEVTESVVDCHARLDACMFEQVEAATCKLECNAEHVKDCLTKCGTFKKAHRASSMFETFHEPNYVEKVAQANETRLVNGSNVTVVVNVTEKEVVGVEPLPVAEVHNEASGVAADFRFHTNESTWLNLVSDYCSNYFCKTAGVDSYICVECVNRLNTSVEHALFGCHVGCQMHHTDRVSEAEQQCDDRCVHREFEAHSCRLECEIKPEEACEEKCREEKAKRAGGELVEQVLPWRWPKNDTNASA